MDDEFTTDLPYQKRTFISKLNPESPPFQPSSHYQHIQEISQPEFSSKNNNNHLHIQPITNGHHHEDNYYSTTIHSIEPSRDIPSQTHYIQETILDDQNPITSSHIESVNISDDDQKEEDFNQISSQQSSNFDNEETVSLDMQPTICEKPDELKAQRELEEDEIPPASVLPKIDISSNESKSNIIDTRPSAELDSVTETLEQNSQTEPDDVLGNKSLLKQTITSGTPDTRPIRNSLAIVSYKLFLIDNSTLDSRLIETITNEKFFIGEYDILPAIDIGIQLMDRGEHAIIDSDVRHCYGEVGCEEKQIPPVSSSNSYRMKIDLEFHDWQEASDIQILSIDQRLYWGDKKRQRGNFSYRRKDYSAALQCYRAALKFLDTDEHPLSEEEENNQPSILIDRYIQVQNNLAQVYLLTNQYDQCLNSVNDVLKYDSKNIKALFRQAKANVELGNYDQAIQPLKLLLNNSSPDVEKDKVNEMLNICQSKLAKYQKNEKEIYRRMFQPTTTTTVNEQSQIKNIPKIENKHNNTWWTYVAMGSAVLAAVGLAAIIKYR